MKIITIDGVIGWTVDGRDIRRALQDAGGEDVRVDISSPGGYVTDGIEIFNRLRNYKGKVNTHIIGEAASMATVIALAGDRVTAEENSVFMIHNVWNISMGDHRDLRHAADVCEGLTKMLAREYSKKTGRNLDEIRGLMDDETYYFGDEMKQAGFIDEITQAEDGADMDRATAVAKVQASLAGCKAKMKADEEEKDSVAKIAAMLPSGARKPRDNKPAAPGGNSDQEVKKMDKETLKRDHSALYNEVFGDGVAQERDRVNGHIEMAKSSGAVDFAHECISGGKNLSEQTVVAKYMSAGLNKNDVENRQEDNPEDDAADADAPSGDEELDAKALLADVMSRSTKSGNALDPEEV